MTCKLVLTALALVAAIGHVNGFFGWGDKWPRTTIKVKYAILPTSGYFDVPLNQNEIKVNEWLELDDESANTDLPISIRCQPEDPRFCLIFDLKGNNIGSQISFLDSDTKGVKGYDYLSHESFTRTKVFGAPGSSIRVYYTNPEKLTAEGRKLTDEVVDGVFVYLNGKLESLPLEDPKVDVSGNFYRQNCFPQMGQHYFYKMDKTFTDCSKMLPFFGIYHNGHLAGFGMANFGKPVENTSSARNWYEDVPLLGVKAIMPNRGSCVDEMVTSNGLYSVHVYFVDTPYFISCLFQ